MIAAADKVFFARQYPEALELYRPLAEKGNVEALAQVARCFSLTGKLEEGIFHHKATKDTKDTKKNFSPPRHEDTKKASFPERQKSDLPSWLGGEKGILQSTA